MASPELLNLSQLCMPIDGDNPAGKSLREDFSLKSSYQAIKDAQKAARDAERAALREEGAGDVLARLATCRTAWKPVMELADRITADESKDLQIVSWWIEALLRLHGFAGLRDGFRLVRELTEAFWDQLYPLPDEEGMATRVGPLAGLNGVESDGVLINPLLNLPITAAGSLRAMSVVDFQQANDLERLQDASRRAQRVQDGAITLADFQKAVTETSTEFFTELLDDVAACADEFDKLTVVMDEKCGESAPPSSNIRNALTSVREQVEQFLRSRGGVTSGESAASGMAGAAAGHAVSINGHGPIASREDAFRSLMQVADFFRRTEPQSPIPYMLDQAVRWGKMPLAELLKEMLSESVPDSLRLVGIRPPESNE
jgi:type VI secretion system protein ImpA